MRLKVLDRDEWRCRRCGAAGRLEVHYLRLRDGGDVLGLDNLEAWCRGCHVAEHRLAVTPERAAWLELLAEAVAVRPAASGSQAARHATDTTVGAPPIGDPPEN